MSLVFVMGEEAFNAAKAIWTEYGMYFKEVENEYGSDAAFELHRRVYDKMGQGFAAMLKEQFGDEMDVEAVGSMFVEANIASGVPTEQTVESADKVVHLNPDCSRYLGLKDAGFSDDSW